jgi:hypothetical protein
MLRLMPGSPGLHKSDDFLRSTDARTWMRRAEQLIADVRHTPRDQNGTFSLHRPLNFGAAVEIYTAIPPLLARKGILAFPVRHRIVA